MKTVKIAPSSDEITRVNNTFTCEFNSMRIEWVIDEDCSDMDDETESTLKDWLSTAIAMSDKIWQVPYLLNKNLPFTSKIIINGKEIKYPRN